MDLEQYKKTWKNQPEENNKVSQTDIYKMTLKKSSSIVKWIFIIGIAEFTFWIILGFIAQTEQYKKLIQAYQIESIISTYSTLHFVVILVFLYFFYANYKSISISENTKQLLNKIIKTRKVVKNYVNYNLISYVITSIILYSYFYTDTELLMKVFSNGKTIPNEEKFWVFILVFQILIICFFGFVLWLFYKLIYGRLLKKLNTNYNELNKTDH